MSKGSCGLCGTQFENVFEAVAHARVSGSESNFNPKFILGTGAKFGLGNFLTQLFNDTEDKNVKDAAEEVYSVLYIAEMRPKVFPEIYSVFVEHLGMNITKFVYKIVSQEAFKSVGL